MSTRHKIIVNLDGIETELIRDKIPLQKIRLDLDNPRIQYFLDTRLNDKKLQENC